MTRCPAPGCGASVPCRFHRTTAKSLRNVATGRKAQRSGAVGHTAARLLLRQLGCVCIAEIATPTKVIGKRVVHCKKVSGDFYAILRGVPVLVEVKRRDEGNLGWADFEPHQMDRLDEYLAGGGISLLCLTGTGRPSLLVPWARVRSAGLLPRKGSSLSWAAAETLAISNSHQGWQAPSQGAV